MKTTRRSPYPGDRFLMLPCGAEEIGNTPPSRQMTLQEAVQLALKHNHDIALPAIRSTAVLTAESQAVSSHRSDNFTRVGLHCRFGPQTHGSGCRITRHPREGLFLREPLAR
jgi:hypothetical protein